MQFGVSSNDPSVAQSLRENFNTSKSPAWSLLIGTDSGIPMKFHSQSNWHELDIWVNKLGVDPMEAIRAATYWPSVLMKVDREVGTISAGKYADIIAVHGDVLRYINLLQDVDLVMKRGVRYK